MFRHLLVPLDGSRLAETVLPAVVALAAREKSQVTVLHVVEPSAPKSIHGERHLAAGSDARTYLEEVQSWLRARGVEASTRVEEGTGDVASLICHAAGATDTDLIALCTHGGRGVRGLLFGRVAQQVLARGNIPVFLLPPSDSGREAAFECRRVLVPLDRSHESETILGIAGEVARAFGAALVLESVVPTVGTIRGVRGATARLLPRMGAAVLDEEAVDAAAYLEALATRLGEEGIVAEAVVERGEPLKVLEQSALRHGADVFAMATHARAGVAAIWEGSLAARLLERSRRPLLLARIEREPGGESTSA